jgi:integrase/recombinase XerD
MSRDLKEVLFMLTTILKRPYYITRHQELPLRTEREAFLEHLRNQGTSHAALRSICWQMLNVMEQLQLKRMRMVSLEEIKKAAERWAIEQRTNPRARSYGESARYFTYVAKKWLRFAGKLEPPKVPRRPYADRVEDFAQWLLNEEGLSELSVQSYSWKVRWFLEWLSGESRSLSRVRIRDVDAFLVFKAGHGWSRRSVAIGAQSLRVFFRHAERRGWCRAGIADGIESPRLYVQEGLPEGPEWSDVQRLLAGVRGESVYALRARAVLLLFTLYGLRVGEVSRLQLEDFDWRAESFVVSHSKRGGSQQYPLQHEVGEAILAYLRVRPQARCRHLFLTLNPPYRSVGTASLWNLTSRRMREAGIRCRRHGPHSLRHACATHLLEQGASLKEIGDLLGHRDATSTGIYTKVHLTALRRVAEVDLGGLL